MSDKDLGYIKGTLDALLSSHNELKDTLNHMVAKLNDAQDMMEERVDKIEKSITWIRAWSAGAAAVVSFIVYLLFNIWSGLK